MSHQEHGRQPTADAPPGAPRRGPMRRRIWTVFLVAAAAYAVGMLIYTWDFRPKKNAAALREADMSKVRARLEQLPPDPAPAEAPAAPPASPTPPPPETPAPVPTGG